MPRPRRAFAANGAAAADIADAADAATSAARAADADPRAKDRQFVTALARGLEVLRCFSAATPELRAADIARMTRLPQPTAWRLCHTLIELGYLVQTPGAETLRVGVPALSLGYAALAGQPIAEIARPDMQALAERFQGAVSLGVRDGLDMVYLQRCQGASIVLRDLRVGSRVPLASSATGWAWLAGLDRARRAAAYRELAAARGDAWPALRARIDAAIDAYEATGHVVNRGSLHAQINAVAVPVRSDDGSVLMSLSSGGIAQLFDEPTLATVGAELKALAARLGPALGPALRRRGRGG